MKPFLFEAAWKGPDDRWLTIISEREGTYQGNREHGLAIAVVYGRTKAEAQERAGILHAALVKASRRRKAVVKEASE